MPTAIYDRLQLDPSESKTNLEVVKEFLRVDGSAEDVTLTLALNAAKRCADRIVNKEYLDDDGEDAEIPEDVGMWVLQAVGRWYELRASGKTNEAMSMLGSTTWGDMDTSLLFGNRKFVGF